MKECCGEFLWRSVVEKCCGEVVLEKSVGEKPAVVEKCCRDVGECCEGVL